MESTAETIVVETIDYTAQIELLVELNTLMCGFMLFFVVVLLCYFGYKFFRIFF